MKIDRRRMERLTRELDRRDGKLEALSRELAAARQREQDCRTAVRHMESGLHTLLVRAAMGCGTPVRDEERDRDIGWRLTLPPVEEPQLWSVKGWTDTDGTSYLGIGLTDDPDDSRHEAPERADEAPEQADEARERS